MSKKTKGVVGKIGNWGIRIIQVSLALIILAIGVDYGKHAVLKNVLEKEMRASEGLLTFDSLSISLMPLLQTQLIVKNFHINVSGTPLQAEEVTIRQGWRDWSLAYVKARDVKSSETVQVSEAQGILDTKGLSTHVKVSDLILFDIKAKLPLLTFSGPKASFDFLYEMMSHQLSLKVDAPNLSFSNGATFGLNGEGDINTNVPIQGNMDVKIKNIDHLLKELVAVGAIDPSKADLVTSGSEFLSKIGLQDITLPLKIEDGDVSLGPITLFKVGKKKAS